MKKMIENLTKKLDEFETLCERVSAGVSSRWPNASKDVQDRIAFELDQFKVCGRVPYCLMALGVVDAIRKAGESSALAVERARHRRYCMRWRSRMSIP